MKKNRKGFTIVELVIVIAVIAILAAVLIPTFVGLIDKANISADQQAVRSMNVALKAEGVDKDFEDTIEVRAALVANGFNNAMETTYGKYKYGWLKNENAIVLVENNKIVYPAEYTSADATVDTNLFFFNVKFVKDAAALKNQINAIVNGETDFTSVVLSSDVTLTEAITVTKGKKIEIDLNGKAIKYAGNNIAIAVDVSGDVEIRNGTFELSGTATAVFAENEKGNSSNIYLENVKIINNSAKMYAVATNGGNSTGSTIVMENCEIITENESSYGLYIPAGKSVVIKNSTIEGRNMICGGNVVIDNSKFVGTGSGVDSQYRTELSENATGYSVSKFLNSTTSGCTTFGDVLLIVLNRAATSYIVDKIEISNSSFTYKKDLSDSKKQYGLRVYNHLNATSNVEKSVVKLTNNTYENYADCPEELKGKAVYQYKNGDTTEF